MTAITREYLDALGPYPRMDEARNLIAALRRVLDLHRHDGRHGCVTCIDPDGFPEPWPCETARALAGTQTDDGAEAEGPSSRAGESVPSSPDRIQVAKDALWVTEHFPVDENDMRLPSRDHPDFVRMDMVTYPSVEAVVAALDAYDREHDVIRVPLAGATLSTVPEWEADLRERIAADIEAINTGVGHTTTCGCHPCRVKQDAARLVREAATTDGAS